jgi:hypothetical protein
VVRVRLAVPFTRRKVETRAEFSEDIDQQVLPSPRVLARSRISSSQHQVAFGSIRLAVCATSDASECRRMNHGDALKVRGAAA